MFFGDIFPQVTQGLPCTDCLCARVVAPEGRAYGLVAGVVLKGSELKSPFGATLATGLELTALDSPGGRLAINGPAVAPGIAAKARTGMLTIVMGVSVLEGCSDRWIKVTVQGSARPFAGWLAPESYCGNPWNSCS